MKGILFTEILFNKTIRKEKTMTRRAGKSLAAINESPDDWSLMDTSAGILDLRGFSSIGTVDFRDFVFKSKNKVMVSAKPTYKAGDVVYIKEPVGVNKTDCSLAYMYDYAPTDERRTTNKKDWNWGNKMFMKAALARHYIRITNVKVERLYDISDEDCLKEGVDSISVNSRPHIDGYKPVYETEYLDYMSKEANTFETPQESFFSLFRFANRVPKSKEIPNLWVWCYEYVLCDKEGNEL